MLSQEEYKEWLDHPATKAALKRLQDKCQNLQADLLKAGSWEQFQEEKGRILGIYEAVDEIKGMGGNK